VFIACIRGRTHGGAVYSRTRYWAAYLASIPSSTVACGRRCMCDSVGLQRQIDRCCPSFRAVSRRSVGSYCIDSADVSSSLLVRRQPVEEIGGTYRWSRGSAAIEHSRLDLWFHSSLGASSQHSGVDALEHVTFGKHSRILHEGSGSSRDECARRMYGMLLETSAGGVW